MKYCQQCETINADGAQFCSKCGAPLGASYSGGGQGGYQNNYYGQQNYGGMNNGGMNNGGYYQQQQYPPNPGYMGGGYPNYHRSISFGEAINICLKQKYASFEGRASRSEFWYFYLFNVLASTAWFLLFLLCATSGMFVPLGESIGLYPAITIMGLIFAIVPLYFIIPTICVTVRRLHDTGHSGWWYWIPIIPFLGGLILFIFLCLGSEKVANEYGPMP